jgi:hypothetical protein
VPGASARLRRKVELVLPAFDRPGRLLVEHPRARDLFPAYMVASTHMSLVMVPLMETALERSRALAATDPVAAGLIGYLEKHIVEEMHGDEPGDVSLDDLVAVGVDVPALLVGPLPEKTAALIGTLYFRVLYAHPVAVLGLLWLEVYPPQAPSVERLIERTGLPREGFEPLLEHADLDIGHGEELQDVVDALPLEPWHEQLIGLTALQSMGFLIDAWMEVLDAGAETPTAAEG